jgi:mannose-6-phosphate isomerase-like protein (cupin superfamily)
MSVPFPGATAVSQVRVYDWPAADGRRGGSPHLHTASTEGYVVLTGHGMLETLSGKGYAEYPLSPGTVLWFSPGTVHRLVTSDGELEIMVVMQNAGLPEAGDAVFTFPPEVLADPAAYAAAAALATPSEVEGGPQGVGQLAESARRRRDLAIRGYLDLRAQVRADGPAALDPLYAAAATLVRGRTDTWREMWRSGTFAEAERVGQRIDALAEGRGDLLAGSEVRVGSSNPPPRKFGMCGRLRTWDLK